MMDVDGSELDYTRLANTMHEVEQYGGIHATAKGYPISGSGRSPL